MARVCIAFGNGCPRAMVDTALLFDYFRANGWEIVDEIEAADLVVVTSCGFVASAEDSSLRMLKIAEGRTRASARMVIVGCLAGIDEDKLHREFDADVVAPREIERLDEIIGATVRIADVPDPNHVEPYIERASAHFDNTARHGQLKGRLLDAGVRDALVRLGIREDNEWEEPTGDVCTLRVAKGCQGQCTYCVIRRACGPLRSKPLEAILAEFDAGLADGHREFRLVAQDLGAYGQDIHTNIVELLRGMFARPSDFQLTLIDLNVRWVVVYENELAAVLGDNASRVHDVRMPLQSGSDHVLGLMKRGHGAVAAERALCALRAALPQAILSTHVLVGFPGETEADFSETLALLRAVHLDHVNIFPYCDREGSDAALMPDKVSAAVIASRVRRLRRQERALHHARRLPEVSSGRA